MMRSLALVVISVFLLTDCAHSQPVQSNRRMAIYPFQDSPESTQAHVSQKLYDRLVSGISASGSYQLVDRQFLEQVITEQRLPSGVFDKTTAVKLGKLLNVSFILAGTITTFTVNQNAGDDATGVYGTVTVGATARLINTQTGEIVAAPSVTETARGVLRLKPPPPAPQKECALVLGHMICGPTPKAPTPPHVELKTLDQVFNDAVEACGHSLSASLAMPGGPTSSTGANSVSASAAPTMVIGVADGITYVNKGSGSGLQMGQVFQVYRVIQTDLNGTPVTRKNKICTLTISDVEAKNSSGSCAGGLPVNSDVAEAAELQ
jgi:hypothetical protein